MKNKTIRSAGKRRLKTVPLVLCAVMLISGLPFCAYAEDIAPDAEYRDGEVLISYDKDITDLERSDDFGITDIERIETYSDSKVYIAEISGDVKTTCRKLNRINGVTAEPNYSFEDCGFSMPPEIVYQPPLYVQYQKPYFEDILHIPDAWQAHEVTGEGVTVAIIDSGFYLDAADFPLNLWKNSLGTVGWNVHDNNDDISPIFKSDGTNFDEQGMYATSHGSNIAGIIGMPENGYQFIGAAYNTELMLIKAASYDNDTRPSVLVGDIIAAIDYARVNSADIINFSLSTSSSSSILEEAINRAYNAGVAFIASVSNSGRAASVTKSYPAAYSNVIGVMAIDTAHPTQLMDFSGYDDSSDCRFYDVAAPGYDIIGCDASPGNFSRFNGASQACAIVSACSALYLSRYPGASVQDLYNALRNCPADIVTSNPTVSSGTYYFRSLDAKKLLDFCPHLGGFTETVITEESCTTDGLKEFVCPECGYTYNEIIPAHHDWSEWEITEYPSENSSGTAIHHCLKCSESEAETLLANITRCRTYENIIAGLTAGLTVSEFTELYLLDNGSSSAEPSSDEIMGTGSKVNVVYPNGQTIDYTVVLFGDVNGDGWYDGRDSIIVSCIVNGILSRKQVGEAVWMAADCNHDDIIDENDVALIEQAGLILAGIDQSKSPKELMTDSAYVEYLNLIKQNPAAEESSAEKTAAKNPVLEILDFIINIIRMIISFVSPF